MAFFRFAVYEGECFVTIFVVRTENSRMVIAKRCNQSKWVSFINVFRGHMQQVNLSFFFFLEQLFPAGERIVKALVEHCRSKKWFQPTVHALRLQQIMKNRVWENGPLVLKQIPKM
jgi:hypothetical protein